MKYAALCCLLSSSLAVAGGGVNCGFIDVEGTGDSFSIYSTFAAEQPADAGYKIPVAVWVYEKETTGRLRQATMSALRSAAGLEKGSAEAAIFEKRVAPFLYDNERNEKVVMSLEGKTLNVGTTGKDGYVAATLQLPAAEAGPALKDGRLHVWFEAGKTGGAAAIPVIGAEGVSVISDIDDTVKITEVLNREAMVRNTFAREFVAVPGMADLYARWAKAGHAFHYVSAGPLHLAEHLEVFLRTAGFPEGILHLRPLRLKSGTSLHEFVTEGAASKTQRIEALLTLFPKRRFILVGDSGERDPEVYGDLARRFPARIDGLYLRKVPGAANDSARFARAFADVPPERIHLFETPGELGR